MHGEMSTRDLTCSGFSLINAKTSEQPVCEALHTDVSHGESEVLSENKMHTCNLSKLLANIIPVAVAMEAM